MGQLIRLEREWCGVNSGILFKLFLMRRLALLLLVLTLLAFLLPLLAIFLLVGIVPFLCLPA
jgi:hypothetical protein